MQYRFEIALPRSHSELLIPCRLPQEKPSLSLPKNGGRAPKHFKET